MKTLSPIKPTAEQLPIISDGTAGLMLIRGAAGSGKTTTAILRLKQIAPMAVTRRHRLGRDGPARILVATFNRTLKGYVEELATQQISAHVNLDLCVETFARWSRQVLPELTPLDDAQRRAELQRLGRKLPLESSFLCDEVDYVLGRYLPNDLDSYLSAARHGRGASPRVESDLRRRLLEEVIAPYHDWKAKRGLSDWNDYAVNIATDGIDYSYDAIIADETQDFSANQVRALLNAAADGASITFVMDTAQRIYPRGFTWKEVGATIAAGKSHRLKNNHRNTIEICALAAPILNGVSVDDDGTMPDLTSCERHGPIPEVWIGKYGKQLDRAIRILIKEIDLTADSVVFLHPLGGGWFDAIKKAMKEAGLNYIELTRKAEWPGGKTNIAICTMNSAKGLEFDHVFILGLNQEVTPHSAEVDDDTQLKLRRLLAMAVTRARKTVTIGHKAEDASALMSHLATNTYREVTL